MNRLKATHVADIHRARSEGKLALFYLLQNSTPIHKDLARVDMLYALGLRSLQLTYNYQNYVGSGCREQGNYGLTVFGHELIEKMNAIGMLIDTSHANMTTMAEAIRASRKPTIISHAACAAVHAHIRNTTDENLRLLADHGGVVGVCIGSDRDHRVIEDTPEELRTLLEEEGAQLSAADWPLYMPAMNGPHRMTVVWGGLVERGYDGSSAKAT